MQKKGNEGAEKQKSPGASDAPKQQDGADKVHAAPKEKPQGSGKSVLPGLTIVDEAPKAPAGRD